MKFTQRIICLALFLGTTQFSFGQERQWSLEECISYALKHNITIKQAELNQEIIAIEQSDAFGNFLPTANASANNSWRSGLATNPRTGINEIQTFRTSSYSAGSNLRLSNGLQNWRRLQRAKINKILSSYSLEQSKQDIALLVANSYLQVLNNREALKVIEKQHEVTLDQLKRTKDLVDAGVLPKGDLLEIEATSADELTRIVQSQNAVMIARVSLAQTLLIKDYKNFDIESREFLVPDSDILNKSIEEIREKSRASRYEVKVAKHNQLLAEKDLQIARGAYYPSLSASVGVSSNESNLERIERDGLGNPFVAPPAPFFDQISDNYGLNYGVSLSIPIFNGFSVRNAVKRSKVNVKQAAIQLEQAELDLDSNVYQAYLDAKSSAEAYEAAQVAVAAQERAFDYAKDRYDVGLTNAFDFSQSKFRLENAQSNAVRAKFDYIFSIKVLELYFGLDISQIKL